MPRDDQARAEAFLARLSARATGMWRVEGSALVQTGFASAVDMPTEVSVGFAQATLRVPLDRSELGIVKAAIEARPEVSRVTELPPNAGSGYWLRAFEAERSVATPLLNEQGEVTAVFSAAVAGDARTDAEISAIAREIGCADAGRGVGVREQ